MSDDMYIYERRAYNIEEWKKLKRMWNVHIKYLLDALSVILLARRYS